MMTAKTMTKTASIPLAEMLDLKAKGLSLAQIGKMAGVTKQAVSQALKRSGLDPEEIKTFRKDKSLILHGKQKILLDHITPERVKNMTVRDASVSFGIVFDKARLVDGESTANVFQKVDLTPYQCSPVPPGSSARLCTSCRTYTAGVAGVLCETCRTDVEARKATEAASALPAPKVDAHE